ncbi:UNVERIFIED_CONTAM: hypothetical protein K2H54_001527 [Gekko kuhli]
MERNTTEDLCTRSLGWLQQQDKDAKQWLWKFSNCFAAEEQNLSFSTKTNERMENKKGPVEMKDATSTHYAGSKQLAAIPLPDVHSLQQKQMQLLSGSKLTAPKSGTFSVFKGLSLLQ